MNGYLESLKQQWRHHAGCRRSLAAMTTGRMLVAAAAVTILGAAAGEAAEVDQGLGDFRQGRFAEALQDWQAASAAGDARGALYVGVLYDSGLGVTQDYAKAMDWYRRAADAGSAAGAFNIGVLHDSGLGVDKDPGEAASWYARAAAKGFGRAEYNLAMLYEAGAGVPRSRMRAAALYRSAASHGILAARAHLTALGEQFTDAPRTPRDTAMQDFQAAQKVFLNRGPAEAAQAAVLFRRAAEQHNSLAEYDLGYCYEHGLGVQRDRVEAYNWYQHAIGDASDGALRSIAEASASNMGRQIKQAQGQLRPD